MNSESPRLKAKPYAYFILAVLCIVGVLNLIDRTILSILAQSIKESLDLSDASLGILHGTAFAIFFVIFGVPLARLADVWSRKKIIGISLFFWSLMTALSGTASSFAQLAIYRVGVGIGEAAALPASVSMIADSFAKHTRATAFGMLGASAFVGAGLGYAIGGAALVQYHKWFPDGNAHFGMLDWQMAFFIVGGHPYYSALRL